MQPYDGAQKHKPEKNGSIHKGTKFEANTFWFWLQASHVWASYKHKYEGIKTTTTKTFNKLKSFAIGYRIAFAIA